MAMTPAVVTVDCADARRPAGSRAGAASCSGMHDLVDFVVRKPGSGPGVRLGLQQLPEPRPGKNRIHLDWRSDDRNAEVERLTALGATVRAEHVRHGLSWTVPTAAENDEFCVAG